MKKQKSQGFTLLELIIVVIIVAVLATLALPTFVKSIEFSRSQEALGAMTSLRESVERCRLLTGTYNTASCSIGLLDVDNPSTANLAHFSYTTSGAGTTQYLIVATRITFEYTSGGAATANRIQLSFVAGALTRSGTGNFAGIQ